MTGERGCILYRYRYVSDGMVYTCMDFAGKHVYPGFYLRLLCSIFWGVGGNGHGDKSALKIIAATHACRW